MALKNYIRKLHIGTSVDAIKFKLLPFFVTMKKIVSLTSLGRSLSFLKKSMIRLSVTSLEFGERSYLSDIT